MAWEERDVENLGRLAASWKRLVDPLEAFARLKAVEQAAREWQQLGGLVYWWHALGDHQAALRVRQELLETSSVFQEVLDLASHWSLYDQKLSGIDDAFARAELLAASAEDWYGVAVVAARQDKGNYARARRALDRASELAIDRTTKVRIANLYIALFNDAEAAMRVGVSGVRPWELRTPQQKLEGWESRPDDLFDHLRAQSTHENLERISLADYGADTARHLSALQEICRTGLLPISLSWHPREVVELTRWSKGDETNHLERAFCCALLCLIPSDDELLNSALPLCVPYRKSNDPTHPPGIRLEPSSSNRRQRVEGLGMEAPGSAAGYRLLRRHAVRLHAAQRAALAEARSF